MRDQQPNDTIEDKETRRFFRTSYLVIPIPMILGLGFAVWVILTEDSRDLSYCVVAKDSKAYQLSTLQEKDFNYREAITLDVCKDKDGTIDNGDGRTLGKVRWFVCKGTTCGPGWEKILNKK